MLPLTLIPGTLCDDRLWAPMMAHLPGHQAYSVDYRDAGNIGAMVETVLATAARSHLIGFSLGGYLAMAAALRAADRFESLTVIAASPHGLSNDEKQLRMRNAEMLGRMKYLGMSKARLKQFVSANHLADDQITGTILSMERDMGQDVLIRQLMAPIDRPDISLALAGLPMPVHFIMAPGDALVPYGVVERLAAQQPALTLHSIPDSGHMIPLEAPATLAKLIARITT